MEWMDFSAFSNKNCVISNEGTYTYTHLSHTIQMLQDSVISGIVPGEVIAILSDYSFESVALFLALMKNHNIIVPITATLESEIEDKLSESYTNKAIRIRDGKYFVQELHQEKNHPIIETLRLRGHSGLVLFSSGSTGKPKAMIHDLDTLAQSYSGKKPKSMNLLLFLMFDHIGGLNTLLNILSMGATMIIPASRNVEEICHLIEKYAIAVLPSSPTFLNLMMIADAQNRFNLSSLRMITYGTEAMSDTLLERLKTAFPRVKFLQTFGTSETGIATTSSLSSNSTFMKIDDPDLDYRIESGELWLRSHTQILGYLNASMESFTEDGWFKTGDLVEEGENGYLRIIGRSKEVINVGGEKVLPIEVESVLMQMSQIDDALVYAIPNAITGQSVAVEVVLHDPSDTEGIKKTIRQFCKNKLDPYKIPTHVKVVDHTNFSERFKKMRINR
ncbi:fatty acid--CoA ligase family protein [Sulfuricurvum sp.]|uniref:ANL family adenylate-forming protein n=1 Tax=Sulfuricurvum sp. TaxID=2025608 RepID=UPI00262B21D9|nr:fatty acid--CoA ligase family protein [Sulfuricurvum sp.]MDD2780475.1 fatty acid--CoA ligase family protein [Sulfuricurvum sp.]